MNTFLKHFVSILFFLSLSNFSLAQQKTRIEIMNANSMEGVKQENVQVTKLIGEVIFKQDNVLMYCDSAYLYEEKNSLDAFGHVHIEQGDSLDLYGDLLKYEGNSKIANLYENIRLIDKTTLLVTQHLIYDLNTNIARYENNAKITDKNNTLISKKGFYHSKTKEFFFKDQVNLFNPQYTMKGDTLKYNTLNKTSYFYGPTVISSKENYIYCEDGWYNTNTGLSQFKKNAYINSANQQLRGDSLVYDQKKGIGQAFRNVRVIDTTQKMIITGDYGIHYKENEESIVTGKAMLTQVVEKDSLFLHGDTLKASFDSLRQERKLFAYHHVKIFKKDLRAACDSMSFSSIDSLIRLHRDPIVWSNQNQMTADIIHIGLKNKQVDKLYMYTNSFIISQEDSMRYNQVKGKNMTGFFANNNIYKIKVEGNGQTIYYGRNSQKELVGVNRADCSDIWIYMKESKVQSITLINKPEATFYPIEELSPKDLLLKNFKWQIKRRPEKMEDIFVH